MDWSVLKVKFHSAPFQKNVNVFFFGVSGSASNCIRRLVRGRQSLRAMWADEPPTNAPRTRTEIVECDGYTDLAAHDVVVIVVLFVFGKTVEPTFDRFLRETLGSDEDGGLGGHET